MKPASPIQLLRPQWPCPPNVRAVISTRLGGCSTGVYAGANLGDHVGDDPHAVAANRTLLAQQTGVQNWPWLNQVHGTELVRLGSGAPGCGQTADGVYTSVPGQVCAVLTADCLPVLLCNRSGTQVAAVHAGWRGLAAGILGHAVRCFDGAPHDLMVYFGPAIGPTHFEVGMDVFLAYEALFSEAPLAGTQLAGCEGALPDWQIHFKPSNEKAGHYFADLCGLATTILRQVGVEAIYGGSDCTYADPARFYSHRRDGVTGRMITAIWIDRLAARKGVRHCRRRILPPRCTIENAISKDAQTHMSHGRPMVLNSDRLTPDIRRTVMPSVLTAF